MCAIHLLNNSVFLSILFLLNIRDNSGNYKPPDISSAQDCSVPILCHLELGSGFIYCLWDLRDLFSCIFGFQQVFTASSEINEMLHSWQEICCVDKDDLEFKKIHLPLPP